MRPPGFNGAARCEPGWFRLHSVAATCANNASMGTAASIDKARQEAAVRGDLEGVVRARDAFIARGLGLGKLPAALVAQMGDSLTVDVSLNAFEHLPSSLCTLADLKTLIAHTNAIRTLPRSFS